MKNETESQTKQIFDYLMNGCKITALEALEKFKCFRLASRIDNIQKDYGITVDRKKIKTDSGKWIMEYFITQNNLSL